MYCDNGKGRNHIWDKEWAMTIIFGIAYSLEFFVVFEKIAIYIFMYKAEGFQLHLAH
jgi:hypothetical protein